MKTYDVLASGEAVEKVTGVLSEHHFIPETFETRAEVLERIKELIPAGASVMNGSSRTLEEVGFVEYLKEGKHGWNNLHEAVLAEEDPVKKEELRQKTAHSDWYLGSAHAITEDGQIVVASNTGSQLPHLVYTSPNVILVVGTQKIVPDLTTALARIEEHIFPLEDARIVEKFGVHTVHAKTLIMHEENPRLGRKVYVLFVNEKLGF